MSHSDKPPLTLERDVPVRPAGPPDPALHFAVQQFLFFEARLLDGGFYIEWLDLLTEDVHYFMPQIQNRLTRDATHQYSRSAIAYFDDDLRSLSLRAKKLNDPFAWTEMPPTRQSRLVSNIEVEPADSPEKVKVHSTFVHHRGVGEDDEYYMSGRREDVLRRDGYSFRLARRLVLIDQHVLLANNLNVFF